eukprot:13434838-Ditylum_brightwellii.AAC.1
MEIVPPGHLSNPTRREERKKYIKMHPPTIQKRQRKRKTLNLQQQIRIERKVFQQRLLQISKAI